MSDPIRDLRQELLAAADRQLALSTVRAHRLASQVLLAAAALSVAAAVALFVTTPWRSSPGFLERAEAALTAPAGSILHYREESEIADDSGCAKISHEIWIDQAPPHRYRALLTDCVGVVREVGGVLDAAPRGILEFVPPNTLRVPDLIFGVEPDPAKGLREAIRDGRAHDEGPTQLGGRALRRIRVDCPPGSDCTPAHHFVDPESFVPVEVVVRGVFAARYLTFEYLPRTAATIALTDIRAQHPDAVGPTGAG
jgi:hypothetical protein